MLTIENSKCFLLSTAFEFVFLHFLLFGCARDTVLLIYLYFSVFLELVQTNAATKMMRKFLTKSIFQKHLAKMHEGHFYWILNMYRYTNKLFTRIYIYRNIKFRRKSRVYIKTHIWTHLLWCLFLCNAKCKNLFNIWHEIEIDTKSFLQVVYYLHRLQMWFCAGNSSSHMFSISRFFVSSKTFLFHSQDLYWPTGKGLSCSPF